MGSIPHPSLMRIICSLPSKASVVILFRCSPVSKAVIQKLRFKGTFRSARRRVWNVFVLANSDCACLASGVDPVNSYLHLFLFVPSSSLYRVVFPWFVFVCVFVCVCVRVCICVRVSS